MLRSRYFVAVFPSNFDGYGNVPEIRDRNYTLGIFLTFSFLMTQQIKENNSGTHKKVSDNRYLSSKQSRTT